MKKFISVLLLSIMAVMLIACSNSNQQSLDGEYYWVSSERNELAFTIKGDKGSIEHGEADRTEGYSFKDGVFSVDISGMKHDYYLKGSSAYKKALKEFGYK